MLVAWRACSHAQFRMAGSPSESPLEAVVWECGRKMGYDDMKPKQIEAILAFLGGRDVFASLPTGYGKSVIYAILPSTLDTIRGKNSDSHYFYEY